MFMRLIGAATSPAHWHLHIMFMRRLRTANSSAHWELPTLCMRLFKTATSPPHWELLLPQAQARLPAAAAADCVASPVPQVKSTRQSHHKHMDSQTSIGMHACPPCHSDPVILTLPLRTDRTAAFTLHTNQCLRPPEVRSLKSRVWLGLAWLGGPGRAGWPAGNTFVQPNLYHVICMKEVTDNHRARQSTCLQRATCMAAQDAKHEGHGTIRHCAWTRWMMQGPTLRWGGMWQGPLCARQRTLCHGEL